MIKKPYNAQPLKLSSASVEFYTFNQNDITYYYFDTSMCGAPEPMLNAMAGLQLLEKSSQRLVMINHSIPNGLFPKIKENFEYEVSELEDGNYEIVFKYKLGTVLETDFEDNHCSG